MKKNILLVDDDSLIVSILKEKLLLLDQDLNILEATNYKDGMKHIIQHSPIHAAILDICLPDAPNGEMIDYSLGKNIPTVVLTGIYNEKLKNKLLKNNILDYIFKDGRKGINNSIQSINRVLSNYETTVLIVDDSKTQQDILKGMLETIKLKVLVASNGIEALEYVKDKNNHISLVLTDYNMPKMDGMQLISELRDIYDKDELGIIMLSSSKQPEIATKFIKIGANDFIQKPYSFTEVIIRVNSLLHIIDLFHQIKESSYKDFLTGAYNRRYFYTHAQQILENSAKNKENIALALLDVDYFKKINDKYGHDAGDKCIIEVCKILKETLRPTDLIARFGGEEFSILLENISQDQTQTLLENLRKKFEENKIIYNDQTIQFTVSIGAYCATAKQKLEQMLKIADKALYECKDSGRNRLKILDQDQ